MKGQWRKSILLLFFLLLSVISLLMLLGGRSQASVLKEDTCSSEEFRKQQLTPGIYEEISQIAEERGNLGGLIASTMLHGDFAPREVNGDDAPFLKYKPREYTLLKKSYEAVWADLEYFPIPAKTEQTISREISYEDSFGAPRDFGGERTHEGCDLFGSVTEPGYYPVLSMTDGVVEKIGWLPLGGYRIGIRAPAGGYFYYAHLSEYEKEFQAGEAVNAGDILGYMGNTGYGEEGTIGQFPVHLHLGIYLNAPDGEEMSVNPYWILRAMEKKIRKYAY